MVDVATIDMSVRYTSLLTKIDESTITTGQAHGCAS